jgi:hypothetical protein
VRRIAVREKRVRMKKHVAALAAAIAALACVGSLRAHHSVRMIDVSKPIWVKGTVVRYEPVSPHTMFELEVVRADGQLQRWTIEGPFPGRLQRILAVNGMRADEDFLSAGDVIEVCGFYPKQGQATSSGADRPSYIHGHVLVMPDRRMETWGPYGKLDNCIRANDDASAWLDFVNADPLAQEFWCNSRRFVGIASTAPEGFVAEVDSRIATSCD